MSLLRTIAKHVLRPRVNITPVVTRPLYHLTVHGKTNEELECRFINFFNRGDIDGWDVRQGINDMLGFDFVPEPELCTAILYACRRINDYAVAVRFLEALKDKCGKKANEIYPYLIQELTPVLSELGVDTPEQLGYHVPEMYVESVFDIH